MSIRWRGIVGLGCVLSACFVSSGIALIGSHSPVSRLLSSSNYILSLSLLARPVADHSAHTPTTTPFEYAELFI